MKMKIIIVLLLTVTTLLLSACTSKDSSNKADLSVQTKNVFMPHIEKVSTDLEEDAGWWVIANDKSELTIYVEATNTDTVLFWLVPTGTETWSERQLIGYDIDGSDGWSYTYTFDDAKLLNHIYVQAMGTDGSSYASQSIHIVSE